jgi:hypothetical protein
LCQRETQLVSVSLPTISSAARSHVRSYVRTYVIHTTRIHTQDGQNNNYYRTRSFAAELTFAETAKKIPSTRGGGEGQGANQRERDERDPVYTCVSDTSRQAATSRP